MAETSKSWKKLVQEADPDRKENIVVYTFGGKRNFIEKQDKGYN